MNKSFTTTITKRLADFAVGLKFDEIPPDVLVAAKNGVLDFIGVALIGSAEVSTAIFRHTLVNAERRGASTMLGTPWSTSTANAALVNAFAAHVHDYDDAQPWVGSHMSSPVLAAALSLAESRHLSGKALICAYVAGFEIGCRLGAARRFGHYLRMRGVHSTPFLGHFAAAAAASKLLELDTLQTRRSFGIVGGQAAGLMQSVGTMSKGQNVGNAAHNAVWAAQLSQNGFTAPEDVFDGDGNIFAVQGTETDEAELFEDLGKSFAITRNNFKSCACTGWRNPIVEAVAALAMTNRLKATDISTIDIKVVPELIALPNFPLPKTGLESKFSAEYAAAVALVDHCGHVMQFSDERVTDPVLQDLAGKVTLGADDTLELNQVRALIRTTDGRQLPHFISIPKGDPRNPLAWDELFGKFRANALPALSKKRVAELGAAIANLENVDDIAALARLCRSAKQTHVLKL